MKIYQINFNKNINKYRNNNKGNLTKDVSNQINLFNLLILLVLKYQEAARGHKFLHIANLNLKNQK